MRRFNLIALTAITSWLLLGVTIVFVTPLETTNTGMAVRFTPTGLVDFYQVSCVMEPNSSVPSGFTAQGVPVPAGYNYRLQANVLGYLAGIPTEVDLMESTEPEIIRYPSPCNTDVDGDEETTVSDFNDFFENFGAVPPVLCVLPFNG